MSKIAKPAIIVKNVNGNGSGGGGGGDTGAMKFFMIDATSLSPIENLVITNGTDTTGAVLVSVQTTTADNPDLTAELVYFQTALHSDGSRTDVVGTEVFPERDFWVIFDASRYNNILNAEGVVFHVALVDYIQQETMDMDVPYVFDADNNKFVIGPVSISENANFAVGLAITREY